MDNSNLYYGDENLDDCTQEQYDAWINNQSSDENDWSVVESGLFGDC
jgi:hypothetical protein